MALGGGMSCVKYLLFAFNLLFAITGLIILIVGIKAEISASPYMDLTDEKFYTSGPAVLIIVGIIVFIVAFFGCCGAVKENHCMIVTFSVFLLIIFVAELGVGIAGYMKHNDLETSIMKHLNESIKQYPTDPNVKKTFDIVQTDLQCCGITGPGDWKNNSLPIPETCCNGQVITSGVAAPCTPDSPNFHTDGCLNKLVVYFKDIALLLGGVGLGIAFVQTNCNGQVITSGVAAPCTPDSPNFHTDGCLNKLVNYFKDIALLLGGVGLGIALVQLLGVIFACCLARSIRSQYETV